MYSRSMKGSLSSDEAERLAGRKLAGWGNGMSSLDSDNGDIVVNEGVTENDTTDTT